MTLTFNQIPSIPNFGSLEAHATETFSDLRAAENKFGIVIRGCGWYRAKDKSKDLYLLVTRPNKIKSEITVEIWDRYDPRQLMMRLARIEELN